MNFRVKQYAGLGFLSVMTLAGCGGGGGGGGTGAAGGNVNPVAFSGTAAHGLPFTSVPIYLYSQDGAAAIAQTTTDASGNYSFTATQIGAHPGPYLVAVVDKVSGLEYFSSAQSTDLTSNGGSGVVNITPVTNWIVSNAVDQLATQIVGSPQFANDFSKLTPINLQNAALRIAKQIQAVTSNIMGASASGSATSGATALNFLVHTAFTASSSSSSNLDAVLDALNIAITPAGNVTVTNRLTNNVITDSLAQGLTSTAPPTLPAVPPTTTNSLSDIQQVEIILNQLASLVGSGQTVKTLPGIDPNFMNDGKNLQNLISNGGNGVVATHIDLASITLLPASQIDASQLAKVPANVVKTALLRFRIMYQTSSGSTSFIDAGDEVDFVAYKTTTGWQLLGNQYIGRVKAHPYAFAYFSQNGGTPASGICSGLEFSLSDNVPVGVTYAVVTGPGLPASGLLYFQTGNNGNSLSLAAGAPSTYVGVTTTPAGGANGGLPCSNYTSQAYFMSSSAAQDSVISTAFPATTAYPVNYTVQLFTSAAYSASNIPAYTYTLPIYEAPLPEATLAGNMAQYFSSVSSTNLTTLLAGFGKTVTLNWTAPAAPTELANSLNFYASGPNNANSVNANINNPYPLAASMLMTLPSLPAGVSIGNNYGGSLMLDYWDELGGRFDTNYSF